MKVLITHGTQGSPTGNWFPWLANELTELGHEVVCPVFPTPEGQSLEAWLAIFDECFGIASLNRDTVLVGHSLGAPFLLQVLLQAKEPVKACFMVSGFLGKLGLADFDKLNQTFVSAPFDWSLIRSRVEQSFVYHSDNDPYVPLEFGVELADNLETKLTVIPNGGHINSESGFVEFPKLLEDVKKVAS